MALIQRYSVHFHGYQKVAVIAYSAPLLSVVCVTAIQADLHVCQK